MTRSTGAWSTARGPTALPADLVAGDLWQVPWLFGARSEATVAGRGRLILYRLSAEPPDLVREAASPSLSLNAALGGLTLLGADLGSSAVESGGGKATIPSCPGGRGGPPPTSA